MTNKPEWLLALPTCRAYGEPARYIPPEPRDRKRGMVAVWLDEDHPYTNSANPGGIGSALMVPVRYVDMGARS